jgi:hypothetical protein
MAIKTTLKQMMESNGALSLLLNAKLPVKASYSVSKLAKACANELTDYDKKRTKMFEDAGCVLTVVGKNDDDSEKKEYKHPDGQEKVDAVVKEIEDLIDVEVEINALPLDLDQFKDAEVSGSAFYGLDWAMKA